MEKIDAMHKRIKDINHEIKIEEKERRPNTLYSCLFGAAFFIYFGLFGIMGALLTFSFTISGFVSFVCFLLFNHMILLSAMAACFCLGRNADVCSKKIADLKKEKKECFKAIEKIRNGDKDEINIHESQPRDKKDKEKTENNKINPMEKTKKASQVSRGKLYNKDDKSNKKNIGDENRRI